MEQIKLFFSNPILIGTLLSWFVAQGTKVLMVLLSKKKLDITRLYGAGGMPSSHSSLVSTLVILVARVDGVGATSFAIALAFAVIVMYDAAGVRRAAGEQAKRINILIEEWVNRSNGKMDEKLKELLGHTPFEVIMGALLGILIGYLYPIY